MDDLFAAGASALGSLAQGWYNVIGQQNAQAFNSLEAQKNRDFQEYMWNKNNEYNTPARQKQRLLDAGLNPYLMLSGGSAGNAQSVPMGNAASSNTAPQFNSNPAQGISDAILQRAAIKKTESETRINDIERQFRAAKLFEEIEQMKAGTKNKNSQRYLFDIQNNIARQEWYYQMRTLDNRVEEANLGAEFKRREIDAIVQSTEATFLHNTWQQIENSFANRKNDLELKRLVADIGKLIAESKRATMEANMMYGEDGFYSSQMKSMFGSNGYYSKQGTYFDSLKQLNSLKSKYQSIQNNVAAKYAFDKAASEIQQMNSQSFRNYDTMGGQNFINQGKLNYKNNHSGRFGFQLW